MTLTPNEYEIEITADCNAACPLCARTMMGMPLRGNDSISFEDFKKIFPTRQSIENKIFKFIGVLGDPILHPDLIPILKYLSSNHANYILLNTNGSYNNVEWWKELASIDKLQIEFSIDGHRETNHIYRVNTKWENIERNITAFMEAGGDGGWTFLTFEHNDIEYETARDHAYRLGMEFQHRTSGRILTIPKVTASVKTKKTKDIAKVSLGESNVFKHENNSKIKDVVRSAIKRDTKKLTAIANTISCKHLEKSRVYIGADMTLWPCCYLYDEYKWLQSTINIQRKNNNIGLTTLPAGFNDLRTHSIEEILSSEFYVNLKNRWDPKSDDFVFRCLKSCGNNAAYHADFKKIKKSSE
jgi:MoaA/NifB/PqqE/SkfB family radical SAM enzyme